jgi:hypothetical protein
VSTRWIILIVAAAGMVVALVAVIALLIVDGDSDTDPDDTASVADDELGLFNVDQEPLVEEFNADWDRFRRGSFWIESSVERERISDGETLNSSQIYAQLPPHRVISGLGATTGMFDQKLVNCAGDQIETASPCVTGESSRAYGDVVIEEAAARETYFESGSPAYLLRRDDAGCYGLLLARRIATPPYGQAATFCFDEETGALIRNVIDRETTIETTTAIEVRTDVSREEIATLLGDSGR